MNKVTLKRPITPDPAARSSASSASVASARRAIATAQDTIAAPRVAEALRIAAAEQAAKDALPFWKKEAFMGIPVWKVAAGSVGVLSVTGIAWTLLRSRTGVSK